MYKLNLIEESLKIYQIKIRGFERKPRFRTGGFQISIKKMCLIDDFMVYE